jgi:hypothetical protein
VSRACPGCDQPVEERVLACPPCTSRLPGPLLAVVAETYREGSLYGHALAVDRAQQWLRVTRPPLRSVR